jgi:hypothetical protein
MLEAMNITGARLLVEAAIALAVKSHRGQTTLDGLPYILHPLRVMVSFKDPEDNEARIAAVLHDVVEDCSVTSVDLIDQGFPLTVVAAIDALSRREGESYNDYIRRVGANRLGRPSENGRPHRQYGPEAIEHGNASHWAAKKVLRGIPLFEHDSY